MAASVVCTFCGAKIKEGRTKCLRCGEALVPAAVDAKAPGRVPSFVARHRGQLTIAGSVLSVAALLVIAISLQSSGPLVPENAGTTGPQFRAPAAAPPSSAPGAEEGSKGVQPVTDLDVFDRPGPQGRYEITGAHDGAASGPQAQLLPSSSR